MLFVVVEYVDDLLRSRGGGTLLAKPMVDQEGGGSTEELNEVEPIGGYGVIFGWIGGFEEF